MITFTQVLSYIQNEDLTNDDLNKIVDAVKWNRAQNARKVARTLRVGDQVQFRGRNGLVVGRLERIKIKNATVVAGTVCWTVPLSMLESI